MKSAHDLIVTHQHADQRSSGREMRHNIRQKSANLVHIFEGAMQFETGENDVELHPGSGRLLTLSQQRIQKIFTGVRNHEIGHQRLGSFVQRTQSTLTSFAVLLCAIDADHTHHFARLPVEEVASSTRRQVQHFDGSPILLTFDDRLKESALDPTGEFLEIR